MDDGRPITPPIEEDKVKTFLKIRLIDAIDRPYFHLLDNKHTIKLYDPVLKKDSAKTITFEIDKIYSNPKENSSMFDEITENCISECLEGKHFTFISYGDSNSDKTVMLYGGHDCYKNVNSRGIFPRILTNLFNTINQKKQTNNNYSVDISYLCINKSKLIDVSKFIGTSFTNFTQKDFMRNAINIKLNQDMIQKFKKVPINNPNDVLFFLDQLFELLDKLEQDNLHVLTWSHFAFILYINDEHYNVISTISFILLAGNERLATKVTHPKSSNMNLIENTKNLVDIQYTFDNIIENIRSHSTITDLEQSKLVAVLKDVSFNYKPKRKFRIIGSVVPNTGLYVTVKDTLMFLFECKKTVKMRPVITKEIKDLKNDEFKKDDIIYDLESKLKVQQNQIKELSERLEYKQSKIDAITENYKQQVDCIKKAFNFNGDVNILLSGNEYTKEAKYARSARDALDNSRIKSIRIEELENQIKKLKDQINKLKHVEDLKKPDQKMMTMFNQIKENSISELHNLKCDAKHLKEIEELKRKNLELEELNIEYQNELSEKNNVIFAIPESLNNHIDNNAVLQKVKNDTKKRIKEHFQKELVSMQENLINEHKINVEKQEKIIEKKNEEIKLLKSQCAELQHLHDNKVQSYLDETLRLKDTLDNFIDTYKACFDTRKFGKNINSVNNFKMLLNLKNEFEKKMDLVENSINEIQYPLLYASLNLRGISKTKTRTKTKTNIDANKDSEYNEKSNNESFKPSNTLDSQKELYPPNKTIEVNKCTNTIFKSLKSDEQIELMNQDELITYAKSLHETIYSIKDYSDKYIRHQKGYAVPEFEVNSKTVQNLHEKSAKLKLLLDEQVKINNKNKVLLTTNERMIERLNSENLMLKTTLHNKKVETKTTYPRFWTSANQINNIN